jgi:hypothetical protein
MAKNWRSLLVNQVNSTTPPEKPKRGFGNPDQSDDRECQCTPVNERVVLEAEDSKQTPSNGDASWEVALRGRERVGCGSALKEEQGKKDKDFGPDAREVCRGVQAKGSECGNNDEDSGPTMVERERQMNEKFI